MLSITSLAIPERQPDVGGLCIDQRFTAALWLPDADAVGLLVTEDRAGQPRNSIPDFRENVAAVEALLEEPGALTPWYEHLGVVFDCAETNAATRRRVSVPSVERVNAGLDALRLPPAHAAPRLTSQEGGVFSAEAGLREVAEQQRFFAATEGEHLVHDMLGHAVVAQTLVPPRHMTLLAKRGRKALRRGRSPTVETMIAIDEHLSAQYVGGLAVMALAEERDANTSTGAERRNHLDESREIWQAAARKLNTLAGEPNKPQTVEQAATEFREHCLFLRNAAIRYKATHTQ